MPAPVGPPVINRLWLYIYRLITVINWLLGYIKWLRAIVGWRRRDVNLRRLHVNWVGLRVNWKAIGNTGLHAGQPNTNGERHVVPGLNSAGEPNSQDHQSGSANDGHTGTICIASCLHKFLGQEMPIHLLNAGVWFAPTACRVKSVARRNVVRVRLDASTL